MDPVNLPRTYLRHGNFRKANLIGADLAGSDLRHADMAGADLTGANLRCANVEDVNFTGADLERADLIGAFGLTVEQLVNARDITAASLPDYIDETEVQERRKLK